MLLDIQHVHFVFYFLPQNIANNILVGANKESRNEEVDGLLESCPFRGEKSQVIPS